MRDIVVKLGMASEKIPTDIKLMTELSTTLIKSDINLEEQPNCILVNNLKEVIYAILNIKISANEDSDQNNLDS